MTFDPTRPVQTRDGRKARIIATDLVDPTYSIVAIILERDGIETVRRYTAEGNGWSDGRAAGLDLINAPERTEWFMNLYPFHGSGYYGSRKQADENAAGTRIGVIKFAFVVGRPVSAEVLPA